MPADESNGIVGSHMRYLSNLTVKLRGRAQAPDWSRGRTVTTRARGETTVLHGPLQRLLGARWFTDHPTNARRAKRQ
jgi:hypothetical protein